MAGGWAVGGGRGAVPAHAMINEVLVAFDPFNKLLKLKNAQEYCKLVGHHFFASAFFFSFVYFYLYLYLSLISFLFLFPFSCCRRILN